MLSYPWLAVAVPLLVALALALYQRRRGRVARALGDGALVARLFGADLRRWPRARFAALIAAAALLGVAAADPRWGAAAEGALQEAPDVVLLLDASNSMLTPDVAPSRLARERTLAAELLAALERSRVGVVVFAGRAFVLTPPTADQGAVRLYLDALDPGIVIQTGSSLAAALHQGVALLAGGRGGALVLVSDGDALEEEPAVLAEADLARRAGVKVFTVGLGTPAGGAVPDVDPTTGVRRGYKHEPNGEIAVSRLNARLLEEIARRSGGEYFANPATAAPLGARLRHLPTRPSRPGTNAGASEGLAPRYAWFAAAALLLLASEALFSRRSGARRAA